MAAQGIESFNIGGKLQNLEVTLTNYKRDKIIDIRSIVTDITFYENIFAETMHGHLTMIDSVGLLSGYGPFQILGEEYLNIKYSIPDPSAPEKDLEFFVYSIGPIENAQNMKHKRYMLSFCSEESVRDAYTNIQKSYKQPISESVKDVVSNFLKSKKKLEVEETRGVQNLVVPLLSPFRTIDFFRRRSISAMKQHNSGSYVFFETTDGFKFKDIETLIQDGREKIKKDSKYYTYSITQSDLQNPNTEETNTNSSDPRNYNVGQFKTLYSFRQSKKADTVEKIKMGLFQSKTNVFDPINVAISPQTFQFDQNKSIALGKNPENSEPFLKDFVKNPEYLSTIMNVVKDSSVPDTYLDSIVPNRISYMTRLSQNMFSANVIGDPRILAGDVITIPNLPAFKDIDGLGNIDELLSGDFLIAGITHKISQETYTAEYEIYRNGYNKKVDDSAQ